MITRLSICNQSIQPLWRDVFDGMMGFYHKQFSFMEENVILDLFNQVDMMHGNMPGRNILSKQLKLHLSVPGLQVK